MLRNLDDAGHDGVEARGPLDLGQLDGPGLLAPRRRVRMLRRARRDAAATTASRPGDDLTAEPFTAEPALFAAPLVQQRDGTWALVGFRNLEAHGVDGFEILDPIPCGSRTAS